MLQPIALCTVGTSLFYPNLSSLKDKINDPNLSPVQRELGQAFRDADWRRVAQALAQLPNTDRTCGAEINSVAALVQQKLVTSNCGIYLFHSATSDGRSIGEILRHYFELRQHVPVCTIEVADLTDTNPMLFRNRGLRNLASEMCKVLREYTPGACLINATGGYKAQIAVAVLLGQAMEIPVCYMHERFSEIITFPPLPVALDLETWMSASPVLYQLEAPGAQLRFDEVRDDWQPKFDALVNREPIDGVEYLALSPTGQIFHESFRQRFRKQVDALLPPAAKEKKEPRLEKAGWLSKYPQIEAWMRRVTQEVGPVVQCVSFYYNPDLSEPIRFRIGSHGLEGIFSTSGVTVKFRIEHTGKTPQQEQALLAYLNDWLQ